MAVFDNHFALVIGVDHYPKFKPLAGAIADATAMRDWFIDHGTGGGLDPSNVAFVTSASVPPRPLDDDVDDALEDLMERAKASAEEGRRLYFYFSGHGAALEPRGLALCLAKWSHNRRAALNAIEYAQFAQGSGLFQEVVFFLDCCRNRVVKPAANPPDLQLFSPGPFAARSRHLLAYATEHTDRSYEVNVTEDQRRGIFTTALLSTLGMAPNDGGVGVPLSQLTTRLYAEVPRLAKERNVAQSPEVESDFRPTEEPRFGLASMPGELVIDLDPGRAEVVLYGGDGGELRRGGASTSPWHVRIGSSLLMLEDTHTGEQKSVRYHAKPGEDIHVSF